MTAVEQDIRPQNACVLTVRYTWRVGDGHAHPEHTFLCAEDPQMIARAAAFAADGTPDGIRLIAVDYSESGGRRHPWRSLEWARAGDRSLVKRGKWIYLGGPTPGWFLITSVSPRINDDLQAVTRITVNGRGPSYLVDYAPDSTVAVRYTNPDE